MITSKLTSKAQTTIPQPVRAALRLQEGDELAYAIEAGRVVLTRAQPEKATEDPFKTFSEWESQADSEAMPGYDVWDLVKVPFPYTNRPVQRRRPALVVAIPDAPGGRQFLCVVMVTSAANRGWPGDVAVSALEGAGLPAPSVIRTAKIATMEARDTERIGRLPDSDRHFVTAALRASLAHVLGG